MSNTDEAITVLEAIAAIQRAAYEAAGVSCAELVDHLRRRRQRARAFDLARPRYLPAVEELSAEDRSLDYLTRSFEERATTLTPTPFEDPQIYSWLRDTWRYHANLLYAGADVLRGKPLIFASAPTGRFNAIAVPASDGFGIVVESGLWQIARRLCIELDPLLYATRKNLGYRREPSDVRDQCARHPDIIGRICELCVGYIVDGVCPPLKPCREDFGAPAGMHDTMFFGFIMFVIEHEMHHLVATLQASADETAGARFDSVWRYVEKIILPGFETPPTREWLGRVFARHYEELSADVRGLNRLLMLGLKQRTVSPTLTGSLLFFHFANACRTVMLMIEDPTLLTTQADMTQDGLFLAGLLCGDSHPYPAVRRLSAIAASKKVAAANAEFLQIEDDRLAVVFEFVLIRLAEGGRDRWEGVYLHPKWHADLCALVGM